MSPVNEIIQVSITEVTGDQTLATFDTPLILAKASETPGTAYASRRAALFNNTSAGLLDHKNQWGTASDTHKSATIGNAQSPAVERFYTAKRDTPVAQVKTVTLSKPLVAEDVLVGVVNAQSIEIEFDDDHATTMTAAAAAIEALVGVATCAAVGNMLTLTADSNWFLDISLVVDGADPPTIETAVSTPGKTIVDDIDALLGESETNKWYALCPVETDIGLIMSAALKIEGTEKILIVQTNEPGAKDGADDTNVAVWLSALGYKRTIPVYRHVTTDHFNVALAFWWLSREPGSVAIANKMFAAVAPSTSDHISTSELATLEARHLNTYRKFTEQHNLLRKGVRADGNPADATRDLDAVRNYAREVIFNYFVQTPKPSAAEDGQVEFRGLLEKILTYAVDKRIANVSEPSAIASPTIEGRTYKGAKVQFKLDKGVIDAELEIIGGL